ncbi:M48 family metallopeptidase [Anatilimnocola floriformis]|uniref:M48 family metallopeptidase n=1 Tax=Anatilimnocola floriformis TaxID=2948575 RepID=UPI0020C2035D|nr:SprT family zinc-dependent metalloprotease [Anatilimnocola floriformis]
MTTERQVIEVRDIPVEVLRKDIKNLHVGVYPPAGRVRVAAPLHLDDDAIRLAVVSRLGWIRRQQQSFQHQDRQSQREVVTGESHFFQGSRYLLDVVEHEGPSSVEVLNNTTLVLRTRAGSDQSTRDAVLQRWYRQRLREQLPDLVAKWQPRLGVTIDEVRIKKMKTRWGTCNIEARRIWVNLELVKKPQACLEFILVHEMVHLLERHHNDRFRAIMDEQLPHWRVHRDELNRAPLAHEDWRY